MLVLAEENHAKHDQLMSRTRERFEKGVGQRADYQLAEGRTALARSTVTNRKAGFEDARVRYKRQVGEPISDMTKPDSIARAIPPAEELAVEIGFNNNPALAVAKADVEAAQAARDVARARGRAPELGVEVAAARNRDLDGNRGANNDVTGMLVLRYNLYRGGADDARIREAAERYSAAMEAQNNTRRTIEEEISRAWVALVAARDSLTNLREHVDRTQEVLKAYRDQFELGKRTMLDLMNSENELFQAKSSLVSGEYAVLQAEYRLVAGMGGLLKTLGLEKLD